MTDTSQIDANRKALISAQKEGPLATLGVYTRLSGPGWLQSAITLGGGSLAGSLFLGVLGGTSLLWLQLAAITMGVVMLSAISYVTLSTGQRPFRAIHRHINPVLAWGWLIATMMANIIWCMPQFSLCYAALSENLVGPSLGDSPTSKFSVSAAILAATFLVVQLNRRPGYGLKLFDWVLKALVGMIVICFFGVVVLLFQKGSIDLSQILAGFVPDLRQVYQPTGKLAELVAGMDESIRDFWSARIVKEQRAVMIGAAATAVGINMTFLLPYSMLNRGWDKPFRGLARFDLATGMAIPYIIVTSCVVIASAASFHAEAIDDQLASDDPATMTSSPMFGKVEKSLQARVELEVGKAAFASWNEQEQLSAMAALDVADKQIALSLVQRDAFQLSRSLEPLLGEALANRIFGLGIFGMGFSTIIILMLINSFALCEALDQPQGSQPTFTIGCLMAGLAGAAWPIFWDGDSKIWLAIIASSFGMMLLPIAYITFMMMMNSRSLLKEEKPQGASMAIWNLLMGVSVLGASAAAVTAVLDKVNDPIAGKAVIVIAVGFIAAVLVGFAIRWVRPVYIPD
jgi:Mn2+/Fe2+ NRAMP family transporter